jgi:hypothetical protein
LFDPLLHNFHGALAVGRQVAENQNRLVPVLGVRLVAAVLLARVVVVHGVAGAGRAAGSAAV